MRLTKPSLMTSQIVSCAETDLPGTTLQEVQQQEVSLVNGTPDFALSELLTLPQNFG